jgi:hypothetical protein
VKTVVFAGYWENYLERRDNILVATNSRLEAGNAATDSAFALLEATVRQLQMSGKKVVIILSTPTAPPYDPERILLPRRLPWLAPRPVVTSVSRSVMKSRSAIVERQLRRIATETGAKVVDPFDYLCGASTCPVIAANGDPLYIDDNHMRASMARTRMRFIDQVVR